MSNTPHLGLQLLAAAQAQKHVTHNEALAALDALVHLAVKERGRIAPPGDPAEGDRYLVGAAATGAFSGHDGEIAFFDLGRWRFLEPKPGWRAYVDAEDRITVFDGSVWHDLGHYMRDIDNIARLGVGTGADAVNRFAAKLNAALFTALSAAEGGSGDLRLVLNKEGAGNVISQLYQSAYGGRAETGLLGDEDFRIRVSPNGNDWRDAVRVDRGTGEVTFPSGAPGLGGFGNLLINGEFSINQRVYAGGALAAGTYGYDRWKAGPGGCTIVRMGDGVLLNGAVTQIIERPGLAGAVVTVSVENPSGPIAVTVDGVTGTISAGSGRRTVTLTVPSASTGDVTLTLAGGNVTFARPVLNRMAQAEPFLRLPHTVNLILCQRYYAKTFPAATAPAFNAGQAGCLVNHAIVANALPFVRWQYPVPMRVPPVLSFFNPSAANNQWSAGGVTGSAGAGLTSADAARIGATGTPVIAAGTFAGLHVTADAEL